MQGRKKGHKLYQKDKIYCKQSKKRCHEQSPHMYSFPHTSPKLLQDDAAHVRIQ